jgi:HSP20 family protein
MTKLSLSDFFYGPDTLLNMSLFDYEYKVKMYQDDKDLVLEMLVPGLGKEDINIDIKNDVLTIKCEKADNKEKKRSFYNRATKFTRSYALDNSYSGECKAELKDGILTIKLTDYYREIETKTKHIEVEIK